MTQDQLLALIKSFIDKTTWNHAEKPIKDAIEEYGYERHSDGYDAGWMNGQETSRHYGD